MASSWLHLCMPRFFFFSSILLSSCFLLFVSSWGILLFSFFSMRYATYEEICYQLDKGHDLLYLLLIVSFPYHDVVHNLMFKSFFFFFPIFSSRKSSRCLWFFIFSFLILLKCAVKPRSFPTTTQRSPEINARRGSDNDGTSAWQYFTEQTREWEWSMTEFCIPTYYLLGGDTLLMFLLTERHWHRRWWEVALQSYICIDAQERASSLQAERH